MLSLIKRLCALPGPSGNEGAVQEYIINCIKDYCDYETDALGNLIAYKKGRQAAAKRLLLSAHMDEVGLVITTVEESGLLKFACLGGIEASVLAGRRVQIGDAGLPGVVGAQPIHLLETEEREKPLKMDTLYIDIGAANREEALELAAPGDTVTFEPGFAEFGNGLIRSKALDDRAGCALLIELIRSDLPVDCTFAFTVQEETGCIGAKAAAFGVQPDIGIAVETTTAGDIVGAAPARRVCSLGKGPVISFMDRGTVYDRGLFDTAVSVARGANLPFQVKEGVFGGNESRSVQTAGAGARVLAVSLPCRYLHSPSCVLAKADLNPTLELLRGLIDKLGR